MVASTAINKSKKQNVANELSKAFSRKLKGNTNEWRTQTKHRQVEGAGALYGLRDEVQRRALASMVSYLAPIRLCATPVACE